MTTPYISDDYTITFYSSSNNEHSTTYPSRSISQSVTEEEATRSVLNNYTWVQATASSLAGWTIASGTAEIATLNPNGDGSSMSYSEIGTRLYIRGNEVYGVNYRNATSEKHNGVAIYKSSSSGWGLLDYINVPTSSVSNGAASGIAKEFSLHNNYMTVTALDTNGADSKLYIYKSGASSGWSVNQILTTGTYNAGATTPDNDGEYAFMCSKIYGDTIFTNGFKNNSNRYVAFFKSASAGWALEKQIQVQAVSSDTNASMGISGVALDFDGETAIMGSKDGNGGESYHNASGKVHIFTSGTSGWFEEAKIGLSSLGLTGTVTSKFGSTYGVSEYRTWTRFGYKSCVVSGNYIAASAQGEEIYNGTGYVRQRHSVFILKSSSAGWAVEQRIDDPATNLTMGTGSQNSTNDTEFGTGLELGRNVLVVNSPEWQDNWSSAVTQGRSYVYVSTSAGGWALNQTIDNPYSGSSFESATYGGYNMNMGKHPEGGYPNAGAYGYGAKPALSGNLLVLGHAQVSRHPTTNSGDLVYGAFIPLSGSGSFVNEEYTIYNTESVTVTTPTTRAGGPVPIRFSSKGVFNIRSQKSGNAYKTFIGEQ